MKDDGTLQITVHFALEQSRLVYTNNPRHSFFLHPHYVRCLPKLNSNKLSSLIKLAHNHLLQYIFFPNAQPAFFVVFALATLLLNCFLIFARFVENLLKTLYKHFR